MKETIEAEKADGKDVGGIGVECNYMQLVSDGEKAVLFIPIYEKEDEVSPAEDTGELQFKYNCVSWMQLTINIGELEKLIEVEDN